MIIQRIFQGPGNQMFQYAFGYTCARKNYAELKLDLNWYKYYSHHRSYILDTFNVETMQATEDEIISVKKCLDSRILSTYAKKTSNFFVPYYKKSIVKEDTSKFDHNLLSIKDNTYIDGYFTSEAFFKNYEDQIRRIFTFKNKPDGMNEKLLHQIIGQNSVALSIRRGDFVGNPLHDVCSAEYFYEAIAYLSERVEGLHFYIFSDNIDWVHKNMNFTGNYRLMDFNHPNYMEDFRLMTYCKYHIIPNSTFSWWAAWLSSRPGKIVMAPERWLNGKEIEYRHVVPKQWIKIKN